MADRNQLRVARVDAYPDKDPLAELTRIMGFDPRVEPAPLLDDDLGIDLERELMGEVLFEDVVAANESGAYARRADDTHPDVVDFGLAPNDNDFDAALAASLEKEFAAAREWEPEPALQATEFASGDSLDLEAELGALLGALSSPRDKTGSDRFLEDPYKGADTFGGKYSAVNGPRDFGPSPAAFALGESGEPDGHDDTLKTPAGNGFTGEQLSSGREENAADGYFELPAAEEVEAEFEAVPAYDVRHDAERDDLCEKDSEADGTFFDESEFEAALGEKIAALDEPPGSAGPQEDNFADAAADPFAALASMGLPQTYAQSARSGPAREADDDAFERYSRMRDHEVETGVYAGVSLAPEIETVEVPERAVALADDLDIPDFRFENDRPAAAAYHDLDADFSDVINARAFTAPVAAVADGRTETGAAEPSDEEFGRLFDLEHDEDFAGDAGAGAPAYGAAAAFSTSPSANIARAPTTRMQPADLIEPVYELAAETETTEPHAGTGQGGTRNRGFMVAAIVAGLALAGGVGALAYSFGGGEAGAPALVKADDAPVKVRPENPGGTVVPNQDNKVYDRVADGALEAPSQERLISGGEEPVELAAPAPGPAASEFELPDTAEGLPGVDLSPSAMEAAAERALAKAEDRIEASTDIDSVIANDELAAVAPRRVRTMIVRPDGTLVAREDPAPSLMEPQPEASPLEQPATPPSALAPISAQPGLATAQPAVASALPAASASPAVISIDETPAAAPQEIAAETATTQSETSTPTSVPVAPSRPGDQPVDIVGEVRTSNQMASLEPQASAAAGRWSMQIASQPSPEGAQSTYEDLARRYGGILSGRGVNIVKAEIAGKGTFWRVRVPASSRDDAIGLCERYRSAGGTCFVSQ